jgi:hypothetical protein
MTLASASTGNLAGHLGAAGRVDRIVLLDPTGDNIVGGGFTLLTVGSVFRSHELAELRSRKTGLTQDRAQGAPRNVATAMHRYHRCPPVQVCDLGVRALVDTCTNPTETNTLTTVRPETAGSAGFTPTGADRRS